MHALIRRTQFSLIHSTTMHTNTVGGPGPVFETSDSGRLPIEAKCHYIL